MIDLEGFLIERLPIEEEALPTFVNKIYKLERLEDGELYWVHRQKNYETMVGDFDVVKEDGERAGRIFLGSIEPEPMSDPYHYYANYNDIIDSFPFTERDLIHD